MGDVSSSDGSTRMVPMDILKGILMIGIVLAHLELYDSPSRVGNPPTIVMMLYLGLPVYYIIAGYFYKPGRDLKVNLRRVYRLLLALVITSVLSPTIVFVWFTLTGQPIELSDLFDSIVRAFWFEGLLEPVDSPMNCLMCYVTQVNYFLWPMAAGLIIFFLSEKYVMKDNRRIAAMIVAMLCLQMLFTVIYVRIPFYLQLCPMATAFIFLGALISKYDLFGRICRFDWRNYRYWLIFIISVAMAYVLCSILPPGVYFDNLIFGDHGFWSVIPCFIEVFFVSVFLLFVAVILSKVPALSPLLSLTGRHTLSMALYHMLVAKMIMAVFFKFSYDRWFPEELGSLDLLAIGLVSIVICVAMGVLWWKGKKSHGLNLWPKTSYL
ncbi:MAG: acyltransferase family protein [Candidatus Methanomethylophilaceae archaeon]|nr:acyltransferase family protein [Candidatus Methanomethylophilaceae archaeon]